jgi:hypothetical protein
MNVRRLAVGMVCLLLVVIGAGLLGCSLCLYGDAAAQWHARLTG